MQRWMYFAKYLPQNGIDPYVITVDPNKASYKFGDDSLRRHVEHIQVYTTSTSEPLKLYSKITTGSTTEGIPQGFAGEQKPGIIKKLARYIRGNWFIPDARVGWNRHALKMAHKVIREKNIKKVITTGPPHSTHLIGLELKKRLNIKWIADFRDPWTELYYNKYLYRTKRSENKDSRLEAEVLKHADHVLTVGQGMQKLLIGKAEPGSEQKFTYILNGFDSETFSTIEASPPDDVFITTFIGLLSDSQPMNGFFMAMHRILQEKVIQHDKIEFHHTGKISESIRRGFAGHCPELKSQFSEYVQHTEALRQMKTSHLLLNSLAEVEEAKYLISGKLMEYLASGNAVLCLGDPQGDAAALLGQYEFCKVFDRNDAEGIYHFLKEVLERWQQGKPITHNVQNLPFTRLKTAQQLADLISKI